MTINEDEQFQAASLVKPFIAAAFFYKVEKGELSYNRESRRQMERMIQHSNNASTNWVTRKVGGPQAVQRILKQQYPAIFQEIHLVEYIPAGGKTYRNKASVHDYSRFLYALWKEDIAGAREIKRLMALPGSDRIYTGVRVVPKGTKVYNKTGSTARVCGDMGILNIKGPDGKWYPYTVIGIIEKEQNATNYTTIRAGSARAVTSSVMFPASSIRALPRITISSILRLAGAASARGCRTSTWRRRLYARPDTGRPANRNQSA
jgi:beta-lactamase class A